MKRLMGLDYGEKTVGVAVSDELGFMAHGLETIRRADEKSINKTIARLGEIIAQNHIETIVLGFPKNMDNSVSKRCEKTLLFKEKLERNFRIPIVLWDERLSTVAVSRMMMDSGVSRKKRDLVVDTQAAIYILQGYMDSLKNM